MKKIVITGANGQLGSELRELSLHYPVYSFSFTDFDTLDITNADALKVFFRKENPDFVINCAAYTAVDQAEKEPAAAAMLNGEAPGILSAVCRDYSARLIHISTDYVFDGCNHRPYLENDPVAPQGVYGKTKREGEVNCLSEGPSVVIRTSWLYSRFGKNFMKTMIEKGTRDKFLKVVFDQVGTPTYAGDLAAAIMEIIAVAVRNKEEWYPGIYHFSNEGVCSWYDFALAILKIAGIDCQVVPVVSAEFPTLAPRPHFSVLDKTKIKLTFGLTIPWWMDSLTRCIQLIKTE